MTRFPDSLVNACLMPAYVSGSPPDWVRRALDDGLAGIAVFGRTVRLADGLIAERITGPLRAMRPDMLIGIDEEGGDVTRLGYDHGSAYPGNYALGVVDDPALTRSVAEAMAHDLRSHQVNLDFAPCLDLLPDLRSPVIGLRSFGTRPELVASHGAQFLSGLQDGGVAAVAKHFPGHGAAQTDSHQDLPVVPHSAGTLRERDLVPFRAAVDAGVKAVMTAHVQYPELDSLPATLSPRIIRGLLREELGFQGVVVSDGIDMSALRDRWGTARAAVMAWTAGVDLVAIGGRDGEQLCADIRAEVRQAVAAGELPLSRLEEAAERVGGLRAWAAGQPLRDRPDGHGGVGLRAARLALRSRGDCLLPERPYVVELHGEPSAAVGVARWGLAAVLAELDFLAGHEVRRADEAAVAVPEGVPAPVLVVRDAFRDPWQRGLVAAFLDRRPDTTLVAMGLPEDLRLTRGRALATSGAALVNAIAAAEALSGRGWQDRPVPGTTTPAADAPGRKEGTPA
ncbi:glycoside hydrolase family 3 protein [Kitasatospora phosalacinea]|uniref:glycoside hydrolase family 3 protein n=1 Tax=Kitasatospora phosalacinea TaxID=2065 RepID=UPI0036666002